MDVNINGRDPRAACGPAAARGRVPEYTLISRPQACAALARRKARVKDKWREKRWIDVAAPPSLAEDGSEPVASVPITDDAACGERGGGGF